MGVEETSRRSDAQRNRQLVVEAAIEVLMHDPTFNMQQVADASGLGRTTVYRHFANRESLLEAVFAELVKKIQVATEVVLAHPDEPRKTIPKLVEVALDTGLRYGPLIAQREAESEAFSVGRESRESPAKIYLDAAQARGEIRADMPTSWLMTVFVSLTLEAIDEVENATMEGDEARHLVSGTLVSILIPG